MKSFLLAAVIWAGLAAGAGAQSGADERYIVIFSAVKQAEDLAGSQEAKTALASLTDARQQLLNFQKQYPDWNPGIITFRLEQLGKKIAALQRQLPDLAPPPAVSSPEPGLNGALVSKLTAEQQDLQAQLQAAKAENTNLLARLKEALSSQAAMTDAVELARAREQMRTLLKENEVLKARDAAEKDTNTVSGLRRELAGVVDNYLQEQARAEKLVTENASLQSALQAHGPVPGSTDLLRGENERLKAQLTNLQAAADSAASAELTAKLQAANARLAAMQTTVTLATLEKGGLENRVEELHAELESLRAANYEGRIRDLTEQRDALARKLAEADPQWAALTNELQTLRARLAMDEAKAVPFTAEELALLREPPPAPDTNILQHSVPPLPAAAAESVVAAQRHLASHDLPAAAADYQAVLKHDENNGMAMANLATIEMQQDKLAEAEQHITAALSQSPDNAFNLCTLGCLRLRQEKFDEALDAFSRAATLDPTNPVTQNQLAATLSHKGLLVQAETALRKAIQIDPQYAPAHNNLAVIYMAQTPPLPMLARWHYQKALAAGQPRNPDLEKLLGEKGVPAPAP